MSGGAAGFTPVVTCLATHGIVAQTWSAPGYDGAPLIDPYSLAGLAARLWTDLSADGDPGKVVLAGHSMGGMLALECAATWPVPPAALVLACAVPAFRLEGRARDEFLARRLSGIDAPNGMARTAGALIPALVGDGAVPGCIAAAIDVMAGIPPETYRRAVTALADFDRQADLRRLALPSLCLAGSRDTVARPARVAAMADCLPRAVLEVVDGAGHLLPLERPAVFAERVAAFLRGLGLGRTPV